MKYILIVSSFVFLTNSIVAYFFSYYLYSSLFIGLTLSSILYHSYSNVYTNLIDKLFILFIVGYGGHQLYQKINTNKLLSLCIIVAFIGCIFLYYYGYCTNNYCYHPEINIGNKYHCLIHLLTSIAHHMIVCM